LLQKWLNSSPGVFASAEILVCAVIPLFTKNKPAKIKEGVQKVPSWSSLPSVDRLNLVNFCPVKNFAYSYNP